MCMEAKKLSIRRLVLDAVLDGTILSYVSLFYTHRFHCFFVLTLLLLKKSLAREAAEQNAQTAMDKIKEDELRLEMAQRNMKKMLNRVNDETKNVQLAIDDLKREQKETEGGLDSQLVDLKSGGLIKQATLAGGLLFTFRGGAELIGFLGGDPSHAIPALIQGALAILCIAAFIFL